jgi:hypothetical protein
METGMVVAALPAIVGVLVIERWRRHTVREWRRTEQRASRRRQAWEAVASLDERHDLERAA